MSISVSVYPVTASPSPWTHNATILIWIYLTVMHWRPRRLETVTYCCALEQTFTAGTLRRPWTKTNCISNWPYTFPRQIINPQTHSLIIIGQLSSSCLLFTYGQWIVDTIIGLKLLTTHRRGVIELNFKTWWKFGWRMQAVLRILITYTRFKMQI